MLVNGRGRLRVYLGVAPGVGKTSALLAEGGRRAARGTDVVLGAVDFHDRAATAQLAEGLPVVPLRPRNECAELDLVAVLARRPAVVLVDDLARANAPGAKHQARWEDVEELLAAGVDVISAVDVDRLASVADVVEQITGRRPAEAVPDGVVRRADQVELLDMAPEALRRRLAHGNIVPPERVDAELANYFRAGNLAALRELALRWMADLVGEGLRRYRAEHRVGELWETRERVVVALTGGPEGELLIRRAARVAARGGADLLAVHVTPPTALTGADPGELALQRALVESLGGSYHQIVGEDVSAALLDFARAEEATQLVIGTSRRSRVATFLTGPGVGARTIRNSGAIDVHMVSHRDPGHAAKLPRGRGGLTVRRRLEGAVLAAVLLPAITVLLTQLRGHANYASQLLVYLLAVILTGLVGGIWPALAAAVAGTLLVNWFFTPPFHTWTIAEGNNVVAIIAFVLVAVAVSSVVDLAARRTRLAARTSAESHVLSALAGSVLRGASLPTLLDRTRETFGVAAVSLLEQDAGDWRVVAATGAEPCPTPADADISVAAGPDLQLALRGRVPAEEDRRLLTAFAAQAAAGLVQQRLAEADAVIRPLEQADRTRTALLAAVSHDLRSPLASAKAAVASLRSREVRWSPTERQELLETAEVGLDRLTRLVENLLDMSRLHAGALSVFPRPVAAEEIAAVALDDVPGGQTVRIDAPAQLPEAMADPALLERVLANLVENALRYSPADRPPMIALSAHRGRVEIRVVDRGPGIPATARGRVFAPFQRLGDTDNTTGVGLGLALSRGLTEAMGGSLAPDDTPGGGLTMTVSLPAATPVRTAPGARESAATRLPPRQRR